METDAITSIPSPSSPPPTSSSSSSSITSTVTFTDILQLSPKPTSSSSSSLTATTTTTTPTSDQNDETPEEEIKCSSFCCSSSSVSCDEINHHGVSSMKHTSDTQPGHVIGIINDDDGDGLLVMTTQLDTPKNDDATLTNNNNNNENIDECKICYQELPISQRFCCDYITCVDCLRKYFSSQVEMGSMRIECINVQCHSLIEPEEVAFHLDNKLREIYFRLIQENNCNLISKTCPSCSTMYTLKSNQHLRTMKKIIKKDPSNSRVKCPECKYYWCFLCHAPWHQGLTCVQYRQGDRLLKVWAKQLSQGQLNAQRCPKCKTFIQKSGGCDHMHCNRCKTGFCYRCGEPLRRLKFFGDHYSKFSIFGCKYRYKKESPIQRKAIRGAIFASKLFLAPILGSLIFCAGTLFVSVAVAFLPFYGVITIYKKYSP